MSVDSEGTHWKCITCGIWFETLEEAQDHQDNPSHPKPYVFSVEQMEEE